MAVWQTQNAEWCLNGLSRCVGSGPFERTWPKQGHRDQLSAFKSVWPLAKPNEDSARQRLIFSADRKQGRKWREMRRLQFSTAERLAGRPACRQNKSLQIGVPPAFRHSAYCDECSEGRHLFFFLPPKVTHIMMTTAKWIATLLEWDKYKGRVVLFDLFLDEYILSRVKFRLTFKVDSLFTGWQDVRSFI